VTARHLTTVLPGQPPVRRAVLTTATPGLYLARYRDECDHHGEDGDYDERVCPGCRPWYWQVVTTAGLVLLPVPGLGDRLTLAEARSLAVALAAAGTVWTAPHPVALLDQLTPDRLTAILPVLRAHRVPAPPDLATATEALARTRTRYAAAAAAAAAAEASR
jgi:hypothetical protein